MNIQHPENKNRPAYPTRAGVASLAAVCLWGAVPQAQSADTFTPSVPASETRYVPPRDQMFADEALYARQQVEEEALLAPYADGKTPVPGAVQNQLQAMVRKYARERAAIWGDRIGTQTRGEVLVSPARTLGVIALEPGDNFALISGTFYQNQEQRDQLYELLGKYAYTDEAMPKEKLEELKNLLLKQIAERQKLRAKYAPAGSADKAAKQAAPES